MNAKKKFQKLKLISNDNSTEEEEQERKKNINFYIFFSFCQMSLMLENSHKSICQVEWAVHLINRIDDENIRNLFSSFIYTMMIEYSPVLKENDSNHIKNMKIINK